MTSVQDTFSNPAGTSPADSLHSASGCPDALPSGTSLLNGQYTIERYLGGGGFGITYFARDSLKRRVVIKECFPEAFCSRERKTVVARSRSSKNEFRSVVDMFVREAHAIAKLDHPNIVGVHQIFEDNETAYMALDLIDGSNLLDIIELGDKLLDPREVKDLLLKVLDAISTVHAEDMLHRDISPDNILIDAWGNPILIDFGAAREEASKKSRAISAVHVVKDGYSPQEFYISGSRQAPCSDLYALAATFFHLISGDPPPNSQIRLADIASNKPDPYQPLLGRIDGFEPEFLEVIDTAMSVFPQDRIQSAQEWILKIDVHKRREAALENAKNDETIKDTVQALIIRAQNEAVVEPAKDDTQEIEAEAEPVEAEESKPIVERDDWSIEEEFLPAYRTKTYRDLFDTIEELPATNKVEDPTEVTEDNVSEKSEIGLGASTEHQSEEIHCDAVAGVGPDVSEEKTHHGPAAKRWEMSAGRTFDQLVPEPQLENAEDAIGQSVYTVRMRPVTLAVALLILCVAFLSLLFDRQLASFAVSFPSHVQNVIPLSDRLAEGFG